MTSSGDRASEPAPLVIRPADKGDGPDAAHLLIAARKAAIPAIPAPVHSDDEIVEWFCGDVMATMDVWLAFEADALVGVMVLAPGWIEQLYVAPARTGSGIGTALLERAFAETEGTLDLWAFQSNHGAQRFYERHGFVEIARTDGDNEEGAPDIRYRRSGNRP